MSLTSDILTECFQIRDYEIKKVCNLGNEIELTLERPGPCYCSRCGTVSGRYDSTEQRILIGTLNLKAVFARVKIYRVRCPFCKVVTEAHGITYGKERYSKAMGPVIVRFTELLDNASVSRLVGVSESTVYRIDQAELTKMEALYLENLPKPKALSLDEVAYKRRHNYATVISAYEPGKVLWLVKGRSRASVQEGFRDISPALEQVKVVTLDFWKAYENASRTKIPKAQLIYDRFHIARLINRAVESERRAYQKSLSDDDRKHIKRYSRWVLLKREANLSDANKSHLEELKQANERLFELYLRKESFLAIFDDYAFDIKSARQQLFAWMREVLASNFHALKRFVRSLIKRIRGILSWFNNPISNAKAEGINNVIKTLLKRGYGYKNFEYFRRKVLQKCGYLMNYATHTF